MFESKKIDSPQSGPHKRLEEVVSKHIRHVYQKPIQSHNLEAFERFQDYREQHSDAKFILDSCCGTAMSSRFLASEYKDYRVIGIDQSASRISRKSHLHAESIDNILLLRCNCEDFWRLCIENKLTFDKHFILYPNPYPKPERLKRRWHAHPVFPALAYLSKSIELRSNWRTYLDEFKLAWTLLTGHEAVIKEFTPKEPLTLFERKYAASGQKLFKLNARTEN